MVEVVVVVVMRLASWEDMNPEWRVSGRGRKTILSPGDCKFVGIAL